MNKTRTNISNIILRSLYAAGNGYGTAQLAQESGLPQGVIDQAVTHGIVELSDWVDITRTLGLDAGAVLADACNHVVSELAPASERKPLDLTTLTPAQLDGRACMHCGREDTPQQVANLPGPVDSTLFECAQGHGCQRRLGSHTADEIAADRDSVEPAAASTLIKLDPIAHECVWLDPELVEPEIGILKVVIGEEDAFGNTERFLALYSGTVWLDEVGGRYDPNEIAVYRNLNQGEADTIANGDQQPAAEPEGPKEEVYPS